MDLSLIFTDDLQSNWFSDLGNWHHQSLIYSDWRPRCNPISPLFPLSRPRTNPDHPITPNYLESEHFSPSLLLPRFIPLQTGPPPLASIWAGPGSTARVHNTPIWNKVAAHTYLFALVFLLSFKHTSGRFACSHSLISLESPPFLIT